MHLFNALSGVMKIAPLFFFLKRLFLLFVSDVVGYNFADEQELKQVAGFVQSALLTLNMQIRTIML